jgi:hypothetical protein
MDFIKLKKSGTNVLMNFLSNLSYASNIANPYVHFWQKPSLTTTTIFEDDGFIVDKDKAKLSLSYLFIKHIMLFMCFSSLGNWRIIEFPHHLTLMSFFVLLKMTIIVNQIFLTSKLLGVLCFACLVLIQASHMLSMPSLKFQIIPTKLIAMQCVIFCATWTIPLLLGFAM